VPSAEPVQVRISSAGSPKIRMISRDVRAPLVYGAGVTGSLFAARMHEVGTKSRSGPEANAWPPCAVCGSDWRRASSLLGAGVVRADWGHRVLLGQDVCMSSGLAVNGGTGYTAPRGALNSVEYPPPKPKCWPERWWPHCRWH
jgi:hypothetical protein